MIKIVVVILWFWDDNINDDGVGGNNVNFGLFILFSFFKYVIVLNLLLVKGDR